MRLAALLVIYSVLALASPVHAQQFGELESKGPRLDKQQTQRLQVGVVVTAQGGPCKGIVGTTPVPIDWPEQQVKIVEEDFSPSVRNVNYRMIAGTVKQMTINMPFIPANEQCRAVVTFEIKRSSLLPPEDTSIFVLPNPKKLKSDIRIYLGPSPYIESTHPKIRGYAKELLGPKEDADKKNAWTKVETIYDWVRSKIEYKNGPIKGALQALKDGTGDCEELTDAFIAVCRASEIPARVVWVPGHCYPEFYLEDKEGKGYWFPCQAAGTRDFGGISEFRPILQKGDNFQVPERKDRQRYIAEHLTGAGGRPSVEFIRTAVAEKP
jgi:hypothetical protein